ncbi:hypothetical protein GBA52_018088 [Prunus armeniaca]|nr:hypothetical protein GBA52_018088 [Prunus armeniaca]
MLKSAKRDNFSRVIVKGKKVVTLFTRVLFPIYREVKVEGLCTFPMWDFVQVAMVVHMVVHMSWRLSQRTCELRQSGASAGVWHLGRVSSFGSGEGVSALVLVVLRLDKLG